LLVFEPISFTGVVPPDIAAFSNGASVPASDGNSYSDVLPSFNLRYKATETFYLRFAADKGISRPEFPKLLPSITVTPEVGKSVNGVCTQLPSTGGIPGDCIYRYDGYSGNPNLKPMHSWNFDLSAEWYISPTNSLVGAVFDKQISGFLETTLNDVVPYTNNGVTKAVYVLRPENQGNGYVRGFEGAWNGFFDFLPGFARNFGARVSYTYVMSGGTRNSAANPYDTTQQTNAQLQGYPLEGLSKRAYNAEIYYSIPTFEARVAYNWRSSYLLTTAAANLNIPAFAGDYGQLDASIQWTFWRSLTVGVQGVNLADSKYKVLVDNLNGAGMTYHNWVDSDRRYSVFLRGSL
jgi:TonB-dependent receptor